MIVVLSIATIMWKKVIALGSNVLTERIKLLYCLQKLVLVFV